MTTASYVSQADLGGQTGHGSVRPEPEHERFHAAWEPRALAVTLAMGATGAWNLDMSRAARETRPDYPDLGYYEIWLAALEDLLRARRLVEPDELAAGRALHPPQPLPRVLRAGDVATVLAKGAPTERPSAEPARFAPGQAVRTRATHPPHHTRLPGYALGRRGTIERVLGTHVYADTHAQGLGEQPQWLYTVAFDAAELWPGETPPGRTCISIDAWEPYLEACT